MILSLRVEVAGQMPRRYEFQRAAVRLGPSDARVDVALPRNGPELGGMVLRVAGAELSIQLDQDAPPVRVVGSAGGEPIAVGVRDVLRVGDSLRIGHDDELDAVVVIESLAARACASVRPLGVVVPTETTATGTPASLALALAAATGVDSIGDAVTIELTAAFGVSTALLVPDDQPHVSVRLRVAGTVLTAPIPSCAQPGGDAFAKLCAGQILEIAVDSRPCRMFPLVDDSNLIAVVSVDADPEGVPLAEQRRVIDASAVLLMASIARGFQFDRLLELEEENRFYRDRQRRHYLLKDLVAESAAMRRLHDELSEMVAGDEPVLLTGEAGTGKELLARALHHLGGRGAAAMVAAHCGSLDEHEIALDFFGFRRTEDSGQQVWRRGLFELADGGTVFLDEIHVLPHSVQAQLQRVLTEREIFRFGDVQARPIDVRVVASTHVDLLALADEGRFRRDLALLLTRNRLLVPALRDRREDFDALVTTFLRAYGRRYRRPPMSIEPATLDWLRTLAWPGNVRELQTVLERAVLRAKPGQTELLRTDFELR